MPNKVIFLDRDGVLNVDYKDYVTTPEKIQVYPRSIRAVEKFKKHGYKIFVITNQSCIAKGLATKEQVDEINYRINTFYGGLIDQFYVCPHHPDYYEGKSLESLFYEVKGKYGYDWYSKYLEIEKLAKCNCRKPNPGLLQQAAKDHGFELNCDIVMVGDSVRDVAAGIRAGVTPVFLKTTPRSIKKFEESCLSNAAVVVNDLLYIADVLDEE